MSPWGFMKADTKNPYTHVLDIHPICQILIAHAHTPPVGACNTSHGYSGICLCHGPPPPDWPSLLPLDRLVPTAQMD